MKRFLALLLAVAMLLSAAGCGGEESSSSSSESAESQPMDSAAPGGTSAPAAESAPAVTTAWTQTETEGYNETLVEQVGEMEQELKGLSDDELQSTLLSYANDMAGAVAAGYVPAELTAKAGAIAYIYPHPLLLNNYAGMLVTAGQLELAKQVYLLALEQTPDDAYLLVNLGEIYFAQGFIADAENCARRALDAQDQFALAYQLMTGIHLEHGDYTLAIETMFKGAMDNWNEVCQAQFECLYGAIMEMDPAKDEHPMNALDMELLYEVIALDATGEKQAGFDTPASQQRFDWCYPTNAKFAGDYYSTYIEQLGAQMQNANIDEDYVERISEEYGAKIEAAANAGKIGEVMRLTKELQELLKEPMAEVTPKAQQEQTKYVVNSVWFTCASIGAASYVQEELTLTNAARAKTFEQQIKTTFHGSDMDNPSLDVDYNYIAHLALFQSGYAALPMGAETLNPELLDHEWEKKYTVQSEDYVAGSRQYYCLRLLQQYYDFQILKAYSKLDRAKLESTITAAGEVHNTYAKRLEAMQPYQPDGIPSQELDADYETGQTRYVDVYPRMSVESAHALYVFWQDYYNAAAVQLDFLINTLRSNYEKELQPLLEEYWLKMDAALAYVYDGEMQRYYLNQRSWLCMRYAKVLYQDAIVAGIGEPMMGMQANLEEAKADYEAELERQVEDMMAQIYAAQRESMEALQKAIEKYINEGPTRLQPYNKDDKYDLYASMSSPSFFGYSSGVSVAGSEINFFVTSPYGEGKLTFDPGKNDGEMLQTTCFAYGGAAYNPDKAARSAILDKLQSTNVDTLEKAALQALKENRNSLFAKGSTLGVKMGKMMPKLESDEKTGVYLSRSLTTGKVTDAGNFAKRTRSVGVGDMGISQETLERVPYNIVVPKKTQAHLKASGKFFSLGGQVTSNY